ncbi:hypothetical protein BpHYR1_043521 [Brachionus plicatilis]|uniref:Uncharacterized protein n=1 Tax=Brachionus plicatilis TaxID=10195 RepID=A0A3M7Q948_BRAPC|nr:hypothetical protein BpHYR1_043521 [Brachionus plicatilis]
MKKHFLNPLIIDFYINNVLTDSLFLRFFISKFILQSFQNKRYFNRYSIDKDTSLLINLGTLTLTLIRFVC